MKELEEELDRIKAESDYHKDVGAAKVIKAQVDELSNEVQRLRAENSAILKRIESAERLIKTHNLCHDKDVCPEWKAYEASK